MALKKKDKLRTAVDQLHSAISAYKEAKGDRSLQFLALSKAFENAVEYAWRELKLKVEDDGLDAPSPKSAVKHAARLGLISDPEDWLMCIDARNNSVHDYFGISESEFVGLAEKFALLTEKMDK